MSSALVRTLVWSFSLLCSGHLAAKAYSPDLNTISKLAIDTVKAQVKAPSNATVNVNTQVLDNRFMIPKCNSPLKAEISNNRIKALTTVKISCTKPNQTLWQSFVSVKVNILYQVAVANRILSTGQIITKDDVVLQLMDERRLRGAMFNQREALIGTRLKRRVGKGNVIYQQNVCYVCKGDTVSIFAKSDHLQIKTIGVALQNGNPNDKIRVRNRKSNKIIDVKVVRVGEVEVKM
ncbi:flagellar basal body P-ring formation chaperone FlgA [Parashewanella curva]|uniref:flagellar basal body P-ring formation chaperone FlgA n=1 Tax=Parashewanella curva TaxID=2338552 RepID=UPI0014054D34|nr:flagellar basal body P-ring formation chaperone FlgA [Parashewanella curva]